MKEERYTRWSSYLKRRFGGRVQKVALDTGAGCPNRRGLTEGGCIFCDALGGGSGAFLQGLSLKEQVYRGIRSVWRKYKTDRIMLYFQGYSATNVSLGAFRSVLEEALTAGQAHARVVGLAVGTRPDLVPEAVLDFLRDLELRRGLEVWLELGIQSTHEESLVWLRRGHDMGVVRRALETACERRLRICCHLISGIPGEPARQLAESARTLVDWGARSLKFHPLHVLSGTPLEQLYAEGRFKPIAMEEYLEEVVLALRSVPAETVIQRLSADAFPPRLVAPGWVSRKHVFQDTLERVLEERDVRQGDLRDADR